VVWRSVAVAAVGLLGIPPIVGDTRRVGCLQMALVSDGLRRRWLWRCVTSPEKSRGTKRKKENTLSRNRSWSSSIFSSNLLSLLYLVPWHTHINTHFINIHILSVLYCFSPCVVRCGGTLQFILSPLRYCSCVYHGGHECTYVVDPHHDHFSSRFSTSFSVFNKRVYVHWSSSRSSGFRISEVYIIYRAVCVVRILSTDIRQERRVSGVAPV
jgi:hypothetical protein